MILLVTAADESRPYLADVGYGAAGALLEAVPLVAGTELHDAGRRHRFVHAPHGGPLDLWVLEAYDRAGDEWVAQYAFTLEPFELSDYEVFNWEVSTNPRSPFTRRLFAQRTTSDGHLLLEQPAPAPRPVPTARCASGNWQATPRCVRCWTRTSASPPRTR
ncbi:hypothetical protein SGLAM104S_10689 [Streptomyces glaucescens]